MKFKNRTAILDQHEHKQLAAVTSNIATLATLAKSGTGLQKKLLDASAILADLLSMGQSIDLDSPVAGTVSDKQKTA